MRTGFNIISIVLSITFFDPRPYFFTASVPSDKSDGGEFATQTSPTTLFVFKKTVAIFCETKTREASRKAYD